MRPPSFPELEQLRTLAGVLEGRARISIPEVLTHKGRDYPLYTISIGTEDPEAPVFGVTGGVHGLEVIGAQVALAFLHSISQRLNWDHSLDEDLKKIRLVFMPLVNPVGMHQRRRSNGNGVDLMRNAPVEAEGEASPLVGGHRLSPLLPWYRGDQKMEVESQVLCNFIRAETSQSERSLVIDCHSGFGVFDRIWLPYAKSTSPFPNAPEAYALKKLLDQTYPNHVYLIEPQAKNYTTHGDLWDHLYDLHLKDSAGTEKFFLPIALEMGSWNWVRKNPRQIFSFLGPFNPIQPHRKQRILRRHLPLFDFLMRATLWGKKWTQLDEATRNQYRIEAHRHWYSE